MFDLALGLLTTIGAPVYVALFLVSLAATATVIYKFVQFAQMGVGRRATANAAMARWKSGDGDAAMRVAASDRSALCKVMSEAMASLLRDPADHDRARELATHEAIQNLNAMTKYLRVLEAAVQAAPMLGLLGTVIGMIKAFSALSQGGGAVDPGALAGGIWVALLTTAIGLAIAIPFYFFSMWLEGRVEGERSAMELAIEGIIQAQAGKRAQSAAGVPAYS